jgi:dTDP-4-dehydrorhamnose reductase
LTEKTTVVSPAASGRGWWRLPSRIEYSPVMREAQPARIPFVEQTEIQRPIIIAGTEDPLARVVATVCRERGLAHELWPEALVNSETFAAKLISAGAWAVFDCTGADSAWLSELGEGEMRLAGHFGVVAHACRQAGLPMVAISSPLVFDGRPYERTEDDATHPTTPRGACYVEIEELLKIVVPKSLVLRCGIPFGGVTRLAWHDAALLRLLQGSRACIFSDYVSAVHRNDLAGVALDLLIDGERGLVHAFNPGESNAVEILDAALRRIRNGAKIERIAEAANRHRYMLRTTRIAPLRSLDDALAEWTESALRLESAS